LGTVAKGDLGFDFEIWNELSFGSDYLDINIYYNPPLYTNWRSDEIWADVTNATAALANQYPTEFAGITITNGFSNTVPWPASSDQPERIRAINKHPYAGRKHFPADNSHGRPMNALGQVDTSSFVPTYTEFFPEYYASLLQTETIVRDMGLFTNDIQGGIHGRNARMINGKVVPCTVWITEVNIDPPEDDSNISVERALQVKTKAHLRYYIFFVHKGVEKLHLYDVGGGDKSFGLVLDSFITYAKSSSTYPTDDVTYTSPSLKALNNIVNKLSEGINPTPMPERHVDLVYVADAHNSMIFKGDGTAAHPNLYHREVFVFLPVQVNPKRILCFYYVQTRDIMQDLAPETFTISITGVDTAAEVTAYDPIGDKAVPANVVGRTGSLVVSLEAADYPYVLTIQEK